MKDENKIKSLTEMFPLDKEASSTARKLLRLKSVKANLLSKLNPTAKDMHTHKYVSDAINAIKHGKESGTGAKIMNDPSKMLKKVHRAMGTSGDATGRTASTVRGYGAKQWMEHASSGRKFKNSSKETASLIGSAGKGKKSVLAKNTKGSAEKIRGGAGGKNHNIPQNLSDLLKGHTKTAATDAEIAAEVEEHSTPAGGAKHRAKEGLAIGALGGALYGAAKGGSRGKRIARGLWHAIPGSLATGAVMGATTFAKKTLLPDTDNDKRIAFEKKVLER